MDRNCSNLIFVSGMPRSGSTLLQNLLAQNPNHHCTATNDLIDLVQCVRDRWMGCPGFISQGLKNVEPRVRDCIVGLVNGFYSKEFSAGKIIFDKSRGHLPSILLWEHLLGRKLKVIVPVRDIRDVVASFERIYRRSVLTDHLRVGEDAFRSLTVEKRAERLCAHDHTIGYVIAGLQNAFECGLMDRLVIVPYRDLTHHPVETIRRVCRDCGIQEFDCDPYRVNQLVAEDDAIYGMDLHSIRPHVEPDPGNSWTDVLPPELAGLLDRSFVSIQALAKAGQER